MYFVKSVLLKEIAYFEMGQSPDSHYVSDAEIGVPFLQGCAEFGAVTPAHTFYCSKAKKLCEPNDVLISVRAPVGAINKADRVYCIGRGLSAVRFKSGTLSNLGWHLLSYWAKNLRRYAQGSTFEAIGKADLENLEVYNFSYDEQQKIAEILDTIDEAISQTEKLIAKLKQVKTGMLHDLLTCGLDENGKLRDRIAHPELFKDSGIEAIGLIPKDWEVETLENLIVGGISNGFFKKPELVGSGYRLINVLDLYQDFGININRVEKVNASVKEYSKYSVEYGDCFFTRSSLTLSGIAHCNIILDLPELAIFECHLMRIRPNQSKVVPEFLALWCRSNFAKQFFMGRAKQVTMTTISQPDIAPLPVLVPPKPEQEIIIFALNSQDISIQQEEAYLDKLKQQKKGLMHDLLTGKIRVNLDKVGDNSP